jgi:metal-responsive CopG/Arc/MetJ family transcriptional regulator
MKIKVSISMEQEIYDKVKVEAEKSGTSVSEVIEVATMAVVDKRALLRHTGGLFKQLAMIMGDNVKRREVQGELIK